MSKLYYILIIYWIKYFITKQLFYQHYIIINCYYFSDVISLKIIVCIIYYVLIKYTTSEYTNIS